MNYKAIVGALLALAVVATGAAMAAPGNAPVDVPADEQSDGVDGSADAADAREQDRPDRAADDGQHGPPADLPAQVPDFVGDIHDLIRQHVSGALDGILGQHVSDATPDDEAQADRTNSPATSTP